MRFYVIIALLVLVGCTAQVPTRPKPSISSKMLSLPKPPRDPNYVQISVTNVIPWSLPTNASAYCWTLQFSTDLVSWTDYSDTNCLKADPTVFGTNGSTFFRLKGTPLFK